jgi:hypothetical protein
LDFHHMLEVKETRLGGKVVPHSQESHRLTLKNNPSRQISKNQRRLPRPVATRSFPRRCSRADFRRH